MNIRLLKGTNLLLFRAYEVDNILFVFLAASGPEKCYKCFAEDADACFSSQVEQNCSSARRSLGTTHCGSAVGTYRDKDGNITTGFFRSCIDCAGKLTFNYYKRKHQLQTH